MNKPNPSLLAQAESLALQQGLANQQQQELRRKLAARIPEWKAPRWEERNEEKLNPNWG